MRTPIRAVERREQRVLERAVLRGLLEVVVHLAGGREDALHASRRATPAGEAKYFRYD